MQENNIRKQEAVRLVQWKSQNPELWEMICCPYDDKISGEEFERCLHALLDAEFYSLVFVLADHHRFSYYMDGVMEKALSELLEEAWDEELLDQLNEKLLKHLMKT